MITTNISISNLHPHPDNPRKNVGDVTELADSIKKNGVMQNLTVIPMDEKWQDFMVLIGHRRLAAAKLAGVQELPCNIIHKDIPDRAKQIEIMLEENMQRNDLTTLEEADSFQLCLDLGETMEDLVNRTGFSETTVKRRLNIAKLDREQVKKHSAGGDGFQLSLSDLYELEKIKNIDERNKAISSAYNHDQFRYNVQRAIRDQEHNAALQKILPLLEENGVKKGPGNVHYYSGGWKEIKAFNPVKPDEIPDFSEYKDKGYFWIDEGNIHIMQKETPKTTTDKDREEKARKQKEKEEDAAFNAVVKAMKRRMKECIEMVINGDVKLNYTTAGKPYAHIFSELWECLSKSENYIVVNQGTAEYAFRQFKKVYDCKQEEKDAAHEKYVKAPLELQMLSQLSYALEEGFRSPLGYQREYKKSYAEDYMRLANILFYAGFELTDEECRIIAGNHEIYKKEEKK